MDPRKEDFRPRETRNAASGGVQRPRSKMQEISFNLPLSGRPGEAGRPPSSGSQSRRPSGAARPPQGVRPPASPRRAPGGAPRRPASRPEGGASRGNAPGRPGPQHARDPYAQQRRRQAASARGGAHAAPPRRRKKARMPTGGLFFASAFMLILLLSGVITALIEAPGKRAQAQSLSAAQAAAESAALEEALKDQVLAGDQVGPVRQEAWTLPEITAERVCLPENGRVDMSYFDGALFIGDSLTQGFMTYTTNGFENASFAAYIGAGPKTFIEGTVTNYDGQVVRPIDEILAAGAQKVYILLGTNSMESSTDEAFLKYYGDFLDFLLPQLPSGTTYYLQSIPPVTAEKMAGDEKFTVERIRELNQQIARMAYERGLHYLDLYSALADEGGTLRAEYAAGGDGIHLNADGYGAWREYLITHTVYSPDSPYLPGSPYWTAPAVSN